MGNIDLLKESFNFSCDSIKLYKSLLEKKEMIISKQFLRSATSIGANAREAKYAESRSDFIHKLSISLKECNETLYWLELLEYYYDISLNPYKKKCNMLKAVLLNSIKTSKNNKDK